MQENYCKYSEHLSAFMDGRLDGDNIREIAIHLNDCPQCDAELNALKRLRSVLSMLDTPSVPPQPVFWANAYREARLNVRAEKSCSSKADWTKILSTKSVPAFAALLLFIAILIPFASSEYWSPGHNYSASSSSTANDIDVAPMISAHTNYTALQPLTDDPRISMILSDEAAAKEELPADDQTNVTSP
jgi:hypothetical protein